MASRSQSAGSAPKSASKGAAKPATRLHIVGAAQLAPLSALAPIRTDQDQAYVSAPEDRPPALVVNPAASAYVIACTATARANTLARSLDAWLLTGPADCEASAYELATFTHPHAQELEQLLQHLADMLSSQERQQ
jgi:hypothetical protein